MEYIFDKNGLNQLQTNHFKQLKPRNIEKKLVPTETLKIAKMPSDGLWVKFSVR